MGTKQYPEAMSISDQINNLKDDALTIEDEEEAARILQRVSYYRLIKAYCTPFKDKASGKYRKKASFDHIYSVYKYIHRLDAWLTFLSTDNPDEIMRLCDAFPSFKDLYKHIYEICRNTEDVMGIFSEALAELDRNTVDYMIDELKRNNEQLQEENLQLQDMYEQSQAENVQFKNEIDTLNASLNELRKQFGVLIHELLFSFYEIGWEELLFSYSFHSSTKRQHLCLVRK